MAIGLKTHTSIQDEERLYYMYLCSENKGTDQLCGHCAADLCLCCRICKKIYHNDAHVISKDKTDFVSSLINPADMQRLSAYDYI